MRKFKYFTSHLLQFIAIILALSVLIVSFSSVPTFADTNYIMEVGETRRHVLYTLILWGKTLNMVQDIGLYINLI